jgi:hypothetical protein
MLMMTNRSEPVFKDWSIEVLKVINDVLWNKLEIKYLTNQ